MISETKSSVKPQVNNNKSASEASIDTTSKQGFDFKSCIKEYSENIYELFVENIPNKQIV